MPLAHTEGSMSDSLFRGARAAAESGGLRNACGSRTESPEHPALSANPREWRARPGDLIDGDVDSMRAWIAELDDPSVSRHAKLREVKTHVVGPMRYVLWRWTTGDAVGANMMTRTSTS